MPMQSDQEPVFRRIIVAWYDSDIVCFLAALTMILVSAFAMRGLNIALQIVDHPILIGLPLILLVLSLLVFFSLVGRLLYRRLLH
jgi:hypothetical protein